MTKRRKKMYGTLIKTNSLSTTWENSKQFSQTNGNVKQQKCLYNNSYFSYCLKIEAFLGLIAQMKFARTVS